MFTIFVGVFKLIENVVRGLWHGEGAIGGLIEFASKGFDEVLANAMVVFVALIPFFAVKELERVFGAQQIRSLFFRPRTGP